LYRKGKTTTTGRKEEAIYERGGKRKTEKKIFPVGTFSYFLRRRGTPPNRKEGGQQSDLN